MVPAMAPRDILINNSKDRVQGMRKMKASSMTLAVLFRRLQMVELLREMWREKCQKHCQTYSVEEDLNI